MLTLIASGTQAEGQVLFGSSSTGLTAYIFNRPLRKSMCCPMFTRSKQDKVFKAVVLCILIFVMHVLTRRRTHHKPMFILPFVWFGNLNAYIVKAISCFMKALASNWVCHSICLQRLSLGLQDGGVKCFTSTVRAARRIMVCIAVSPLFAHNGSTAKWAWLCKKSFHRTSVYQAY